MFELGIGLVWSDVFGCCTSAVLSSRYGNKKSSSRNYTSNPSPFCRAWFILMKRSILIYILRKYVEESNVCFSKLKIIIKHKLIEKKFTIEE